MLFRSPLVLIVILALLAIALTDPLSAQEATPPPAPVPVTTVIAAAGERTITIPAPPGTESAAGISSQLDEALKAFIPASNRVLAHFLPRKDVAVLRAGGAPESGIDYNAQIVRQLEHKEIGTATFGLIRKDLIKGLDAASVETALQKVAREGNERMEKATGVNPELALEKPESLGRFLDTDTALGFSMLLKGGEGQDSVSVVSCAMGPVNGRMIALYATRPHAGEGDQKKAESAVRDWLAAVTAANPVVEGPSGLSGLFKGVGKAAVIGGVAGAIVAAVFAVGKRRAARKKTDS